ncbi:MAG: AAA family ATPase [Alphaproteobacteria bacterium]|nr:AAA family ATPase [Alphaproteobacteria bacterium]
MRTRRIHITGPSGAGVTSLGRALASALVVPHHDTDDYYWQPTNPPFQEKRDVPDRLRLMRELFLERDGWVLSGSLGDWANSITPYFDLVIYLYVVPEIRLQRLREREAKHFGEDAVAPGGWRHQETEEFIEWASHYELSDREGRNSRRHQEWLAQLSCPVLRLNGAQLLAALVGEAETHLVKIAEDR